MKNEVGDLFHCQVGLRQGSCISPKLAAAFLNQVSDLLREFSNDCPFSDNANWNHLFYADDLVLFFTDPERLQFVLNKFCSLVEELGLNVSVEKSFSIVFAKTRPRGMKPFFWKNEPLPDKKEALYLGCSIDSRGSFVSQMYRNSQKSNRAFSLILNFQKRFPTVSFSRFLSLYRTLVVPVLSYGCEIYVWEYGEKMNDIFVEHLRRYLSLPKRTSKMALLWYTNTYPVHASLWIQGYNFWCKMASLDPSRFEKTALQVSIELELPWAKSMFKIFQLISFEGDFRTWDHNDIKSQRSRFEKCVYSYFDSQFLVWSQDSSYRFLLKTCPYGIDRWYLQHGSFSERRTLSKLFLRVFNFESNTGVRHNYRPCERFCVFCIDNMHPTEIGDEEHNLISCPRHTAYRLDLISFLDINPEQIITALYDPHQIPVPLCTIARHLTKFASRSFTRLTDAFL